MSSDDEAFVPPPGICRNCGLSRSSGHVCPISLPRKVMKRPGQGRTPSAKQPRNDPQQHVVNLFGGSDDDANLFGSDDDEEDDFQEMRDDDVFFVKASKPRAPVTAKKVDDASSSSTDSSNAHSLLSTLLAEHGRLQADNAQLRKQVSGAEEAQKEVKALQKKNTTAEKQIKQLHTAHLQQKKELEDTKKQHKKELDDAKKQSKKGKAPAASAPDCKDAYSELLSHVCAETTKHAAKMQKQFPPAPVQPPPPPPPQPPVKLTIQQVNQNPQYGTARNIEWQPLPTLNSTFYFDNGAIGSGVPNWVEIQDANALTQLYTLGTSVTNASGAIGSFTPLNGKSCTYTIGQHSYNITVSMIRPVVPPPAPPPPPPQSWTNKMLFDQSFIELKPAFVNKLLSNYNFDGQTDSKIAGFSAIGDVAELFSSYAQNFKYNRKRCELWRKPDYFKLWLRIARDRGYKSCRLLMHGSGNYAHMEKDAAGFDMAYARGGVKKHALYGAASDHVASDYNCASNCPRGSAMLMLLLTKPSAGLGAYEQYHLGSHTHAGASVGQADAFAVRDQLLVLPLGLAIAQ